MSTIKSDSEDLTLNAHGSGNDIKFQSNSSEVGSLTAEGVMTTTLFSGSGASLTALPAAQLTGTLPAISGANLTSLPADSTKLPLAGGTMTGNISHAGAFTLDVGSEISLDSDSGYVYLKDAGTSIGLFKLTSSDFYIKSVVSDKDIIFQGNDGGSTIEAMRIDMSAGGNVGIGTTTPPERLSIHESATSAGTYLPVAITGANYATGYGVGISFKTENTSPTQKAKVAIIAEGTGEGYNKTSLHVAMSNTGDTTTEVALADSVLEFTMDGRGLSQFTAKAWINLNGTGTIAINDSHNVSSITDHSTGDWTVTFTNAMANADYSMACAGGDVDEHVAWRSYGTGSYVGTTFARIGCMNHAGSYKDRDGISAIFFGD